MVLSSDASKLIQFLRTDFQHMGSNLNTTKELCTFLYKFMNNSEQRKGKYLLSPQCLTTGDLENLLLGSWCSGDSDVIQGFQFGHQTLNISACFVFFPSDIFWNNTWARHVDAVSATTLYYYLFVLHVIVRLWAVLRKTVEGDWCFERLPEQLVIKHLILLGSNHLPLYYIDPKFVNWRAPWKNGVSDDFENSLLSCVLSASVSFQTFAK